MPSAGGGGQGQPVPMTPGEEASWHCTLSLPCPRMLASGCLWGCGFRNAALLALSHVFPLDQVISRTTVIARCGSRRTLAHLTPQQAREVGTIVVLTLQVRRLRQRERGVCGNRPHSYGVAALVFGTR